MSENLIKQDADMEGIMSDDQAKKERIKKYLLLGGIFAVVLIIIIIIVIVISTSSKEEDREEGKEKDKDEKSPEIPNLEHEIFTINFPDDIIYIGSTYNHQGQIYLIYQKKPVTDPNIYYFGITNEKGEILKEVLEIKKTDLADGTYIQRMSPFTDGKRVFIGGTIIECTKQFLECDDAKIINVKFPEELVNMENLLYVFTEPIINYGNKYIFWSTFDTSMNIINFVGELKREENEYIIENTKGLSNYFYDLYDKDKDTYFLPKILRTGPIKQVVNGGEGLTIGGFLNYGLRKGIYQPLSNESLSQLTFFEGYDETTAISPDLKLACVMTTRFSNHTSFEIVGLIPTPYSILTSYLLSTHIMKYSIGNIRMRSNIKGNIGPTLVDLKKVYENPNYTGINLNKDDLWNFYGFISWSPDGKKIMFDEADKEVKNRRCRIVNLTHYNPDKIELKDNFKNNIPYARSIEESINLHLDYPINIQHNGTSGYLTIFQNKTKCEIKYSNYTEDNEIFYNGTYTYQKFQEQKYVIFEVNITSEGKKKGSCQYRLWFDLNNNIFLFDESDGNKKSYGGCEYEGRKLNVDIYQYEKIEN